MNSSTYARYSCSTPSGIMESVTQVILPVAGLGRVCSTPSGIMESVTRSEAAIYAEGTRAQRLPASWNRSPSLFVPLDCQLLVLNAFRHHGIGHVSSLTHANAPNSAQRLPASWNRSRTGTAAKRNDYVVCSTPSGIMESVTSGGLRSTRFSNCAQRLPASWNRSRWLRRSLHLRQEVLNAFRHHGIGHRNQVPAGRRGDGVLNAFRHHGIGHSELTGNPPRISRAQRLPASWNRSPLNEEYKRNFPKCSTPSGIMESVTPAARREHVRR